MTRYSNKNTPHSAHYFGDQRDFWWNYDFLQLMAERWQLGDMNKILDVGCGIGHWGRTLSPFLKDSAVIIGIDPEPKWVNQATAHAKEENTYSRFTYQSGSAEKIPFEDNFFDMVTCQTVLIHVPDITLALKEMIRVLKPGGLLAVAEPNNAAPLLTADSCNLTQSSQELLDAIHFHQVCEQGKKNLGLGFNSIGDLVPLVFSKLKLEKIQVYLSDKTSTLIPPYLSHEEKVFINQLKDWDNDNILVWPEDETKRYFIAGGGTENAFNAMWKKLHQSRKKMLAQINEKTFYSIGTSIMYLISGRKGDGKVLGLDT